jgi:hypothetical protein
MSGESHISLMALPMMRRMANLAATRSTSLRLLRGFSSRHCSAVASSYFSSVITRSLPLRFGLKVAPQLADLLTRPQRLGPLCHFALVVKVVHDDARPSQGDGDRGPAGIVVAEDLVAVELLLLVSGADYYVRDLWLGAVEHLGDERPNQDVLVGRLAQYEVGDFAVPTLSSLSH